MEEQAVVLRLRGDLIPGHEDKNYPARNYEFTLNRGTRVVVTGQFPCSGKAYEYLKLFYDPIYLLQRFNYGSVKVTPAEEIE